MQWNFDIQRELPGGIVFDVAYVGNRGVKLEASRTWDQLPDSALALGSQLLTQVPNPFYGQISQGALAAPTVSRAQLLRPFPQFTGVGATNLPFGNSIYHGLQTKIEKRFAHGVTFLASYSFSKLIDDVGGSFAGEAVGGAGVQDWNNLHAERAVSAYDQTHSLVLSYIWELPFGKGKAVLGGAHGVLDKVVGGWQLQGIASFQTGSPLGFSNSSNTSNSQGGGQRPNWTGQDVSLSGSNSIDHWFNTSRIQPAGDLYVRQFSSHLRQCSGGWGEEPGFHPRQEHEVFRAPHAAASGRMLQSFEYAAVWDSRANVRRADVRYRQRAVESAAGNSTGVEVSVLTARLLAFSCILNPCSRSAVSFSS